MSHIFKYNIRVKIKNKVRKPVKMWPMSSRCVWTFPCLFTVWFAGFVPRRSLLVNTIIFSTVLLRYLYPVFPQTSPQWSGEFKVSSHLIYSVGMLNIILTQVKPGFFSTYELLSASLWHFFEFLWGFKKSTTSDCKPPFLRWDQKPRCQTQHLIAGDWFLTAYLLQVYACFRLLFLGGGCRVRDQAESVYSGSEEAL